MTKYLNFAIYFLSRISDYFKKLITVYDDNIKGCIVIVLDENSGFNCEQVKYAIKKEIEREHFDFPVQFLCSTREVYTPKLTKNGHSHSDANLNIDDIPNESLINPEIRGAHKVSRGAACSKSDEFEGFGSIACFMEADTSQAAENLDLIYLVTCAHVFLTKAEIEYNQKTGQLLNEVRYATVYSKCKGFDAISLNSESHKIHLLFGYYQDFPLSDSRTETVLVDIAAVSMVRKDLCKLSISNNEVFVRLTADDEELSLEIPVGKRGARTGTTAGKIKALTGTIYHSKLKEIGRMIIVENLTEEFGETGDSGSLVVQHINDSEQGAQGEPEDFSCNILGLYHATYPSVNTPDHMVLKIEYSLKALELKHNLKLNMIKDDLVLLEPEKSCLPSEHTIPSVMIPELFTSNYATCLIATFPSEIRQLIFVNGKLWALMEESTISIINMDGRIDRELDLPSNDILDMCLLPSELICLSTSDEGLLVMSSDGSVFKKVEGNFLSACDYQGSIVALKEEPQGHVCLYMYKFIKDKQQYEYTEKCQTHIKLTRSDTLHCIVIRDKLFISSSTKHCLYEVQLETGEVLCRIGSKGHEVHGGFNTPRAIYSDSKSRSLLVCDYHNHCLKVINLKDNQWQVVNTAGQEMNFPTAISHDGDCHLIVAAGKSSKLFKLEKC